MLNVQIIAEKQLEGMSAGGEFNRCLRLSPAKMDMILVGRNWKIHRWECRDIDEEVVVTGIFHVHPHRGDAAALQPEAY